MDQVRNLMSTTQYWVDLLSLNGWRVTTISINKFNERNADKKFSSLTINEKQKTALIKIRADSNEKELLIITELLRIKLNATTLKTPKSKQEELDLFVCTVAKLLYTLKQGMTDAKT